MIIKEESKRRKRRIAPQNREKITVKKILTKRQRKRAKRLITANTRPIKRRLKSVLKVFSYRS